VIDSQADAAPKARDEASIRAAVAALLAGRSGRSPLVLFVSADGTTARDAAYAIARSIAREARCVLADLPGEGASAGEDSLPGLGDVVAGRARFVDVLHRDPTSRLHLLAAGGPLAPADAESEDWPRALGKCFEALQGTYEGVIACGASPVVSALAQALAAAADMIVLVADADDAYATDALAAALPPGAQVPLVMAVEERGIRRARA